jgi:hypothetical protein
MMVEDGSIWVQLATAMLDNLEFIGPTLVGILVVPIFGWIKYWAPWLGNRPPWLQQILVVLSAVVLTTLGTFLNVALPTDISLFTEVDVSAAISAAISMAAHAGKKAIKS